MSLLRSDALTVRQDYGQFALIAGDTDDDDLVELIDAANDADNIAQGNAILVVLSPHQNNFALGLTVEQWSSRPPDDLDAWEEGFEASLTVGDLGLVYMSPTDTYVQLDVPSGAYRARIVGRGFVNRGWPGSTTPGDVWRIQVWPCTEHAAPRRIAR
ncbi:hypothetical protein FHX44_111791 [Pseudonocardia hierapolitana]|uniref:Uncharacterized protein n=2 Tax=Pseudonocardia hierapolitana TaxID=1128676 RepID=A0A561SM45_9PSEU|nr:hypothetical protein FHX44_111791 [Pseudonocardia hierapolitana]